MNTRGYKQPAPVEWKVLLVEDEATDAELALKAIAKAGWHVTHERVQTPHELAALVAVKTFDVVLADWRLPGWSGLAAFELLQQLDKDIPFILMSGAISDDQLHDCFDKGITDFVPKDQLFRLAQAIQNSLELRARREECARLELKWREAEKNLQRMAELAPDPLLILHGDDIACANAAAAKLLAASGRHQLTGRASGFFHADCRAAVEQRLAGLGPSSEPVVFEARLLRLDGKPVDVRMAATGLVYQGKPAVQLIATDISERARVGAAIQSLAAFAHLSPNPVLELSRDGHVSFCNEAAREMARAVGKQDAAALLPADAVHVVHMCLATGQKQLRESISAGRTFAWTFHPVKSSQAVHCYCSDITDRLALEAQLRHSQRLESVGRLAAGVAHDFNNILTVIRGHTGLLRSEPNISPAMQESLQQVSRATERAGRLTEQLLTFSQKTMLQPRRLELNEVLSNLGSMLQRTLGEDIRFHFNYGPNLPPVFADLGMLEQIVMNLALNARDAMPQGGELTLSTCLAKVDPTQAARHLEARPGQFICLTVTDSGAGMDAATLAQVFEPFFTTKETGKGTGLGLAVVHGLVLQHQGWIEVQSQLNQGTAFKIYLPPCEHRPEAVSAETRPVDGGETVLVVEDEEPVRLIVRNVLQRHGYQVLEAANGLEAMAVWHQHHQAIALLLTDLVMPVGVNGQELADQFRAQKPDLKVVFMSGYSIESAVKHSQPLRGSRFLEKPFDATQLARTIRQALDS